MTKRVVTLKDSTTFTLNEADLTGKKTGDKLLTPKRSVPSSDGLQWWIHWYPAGWRVTEKDRLSVFLWVDKPVKTKYTFVVNGSSIFNNTYTHAFLDPPRGHGCPTFASHKILRPLFRDGKLTITCSVEFDILMPVVTSPPNFNLFQHVPTDVEFVIGSDRVPAHKNFLTLISPVFQAMFSHNTAESNVGKIEITEFDFDTVKAAIDFCYGRDLAYLSADHIVNILRFCDKYFITAAINELEKLPLLNPSPSTFCTVVRYAYDCNKDLMLAKCYKLFKDLQDKIKSTEKFVELPVTLVVTMIKSAFELETDIDVLYHAHKNGIQFVVDHLERPLIESLTLDTFCPAVNFAWECSRDELKKVCARFLNDRYCEVIMLGSFFKLPPECMQGVLKLGYDLKCSSE